MDRLLAQRFEGYKAFRDVLATTLFNPPETFAIEISIAASFGVILAYAFAMVSNLRWIDLDRLIPKWPRWLNNTCLNFLDRHVPYTSWFRTGHQRLHLRSVYEAGNELALMIAKNTFPGREGMLMFTLDSGKVYVGGVRYYLDTHLSGDHGSDDYLTLQLVRSGYRMSETRKVELNANYVPMYEDESGSRWSADQLMVTFPVSRVVSVHPYDDEIHKLIAYQDEQQDATKEEP